MSASLNADPAPSVRTKRFIPHQRGTEEPRRRPAPSRVPHAGRGNWRTSYVRLVIVGDVVCALAAALLGLWTKFGHDDAPLHVQAAALWVALALPLVWPAVMLMAGTYSHRFLWVGAEEFCRVFWAATMLLAGVGTVSWALKLEVARGFVVIMLPLVTLLTLVSRFAQRRRLRRRRSRGRDLLNLLLVGNPGTTDSLEQMIARMAYRGYRVVGRCVSSAAGAVVSEVSAVPVLGDLTAVSTIVHRYGVDAVVAMPSSDLSGDELRRLGWALEGTDADLLLVPTVTDVAPPRVRLRPVFGLATLQVEKVDVAGVSGAVKSAVDRVLAAVVLVLFSWLFLGLVLGVKLTSPGPVFFRHERIGQHGRPFRMYKFRSMHHGADKQFDALLDRSDGNAVQFKMRCDPRVTPIGRFLRRYSLDELPQLLNVLGGSMSLVGPRPHVTREVEQYDQDMRRRLLVKPGMTGLWQVSGRSDLSWEDAVRTDVRYVENWSLALDLMIMSKTVGVVLRGSGAY